MKRRRRLPPGVVQGLHYYPNKRGPSFGMHKHRRKGHGVPRKQTITLAELKNPKILLGETP